MAKIEIVGSPNNDHNRPAPTPISRPGSMTASQSSARDKAIAALLGQSSSNPTGNSQTSPVQNPTSISMEESVNLKKDEPSLEQNDTVETAPTESATTPEEPSPEATQPEKQEEPLSQQYAVLARKERALRQREQSFKAREAQLNAREADLSSKSTTVDTSKYISIDDLKRDAFGVLQRNGISYDDVSTQAVQAQSPEFQAMRQMREEIDAKLAKLQEEQAKVSKTFEDSQSQAYQGAIKQIKSEANQLVNSSEAFETVKEMGAVQDVVDLIEKTFKEDGILMTVEEAAAQVEEYLVEEALRLARLKKVQLKLKPAEAVQKAQPTATQATQQAPAKQMTTLSNAGNTSRQLSGRERALLAFKGEKF